MKAVLFGKSDAKYDQGMVRIKVNAKEKWMNQIVQAMAKHWSSYVTIQIYAESNVEIWDNFWGKSTNH